MRIRQHLPYFLWWVVIGAIPVVVRIVSQGILEGSDGVQHYLIARYAWQHPDLFLDHWGKPLFTLFASPFAQLGHWGMALFNACCFMVTCWAADGVLRWSGAAARWIFPPALLLVPVYGTMVLAGMTEVFFGMLAMLVVRTLFEERFVAAMIILSFMPFARPEYIAFAPFGIGWVIWREQWRALPWVFTGHLVYGVLGAVVIGDPLWAIHNDPYNGAANIYGHGTPFHFTDQIQHIYGAALIWAVGLALVSGCYMGIRSTTDRAALGFLAWMALLPSLAILAVHSFLWWKGLKSSLGLFRVLATCAPLLVLFATIPLVRGGTVYSRKKWTAGVTAVVLGAAYVTWAASCFAAERPLPIVEGAYDRFIRKVGLRVKDIKPDHAKVIYDHPDVAWHAGIDPFDTTEVGNYSAMGAHDLLVWDAHHSPNEGGLVLEILLADPSLELLEVMAPDERMIVLGGQPFEVFLFTKRPAIRRHDSAVIFDQGTGIRMLPLRIDTVPQDGRTPRAWYFDGREFPFETGPFPTDNDSLIYSELVVTGDIQWLQEASDGTLLVFEEQEQGTKMSYWTHRLEGGAFEVRYRIPRRGHGGKNNLFIWNPARKQFRLNGMKAEWIRVLKAE